MIDPRARHDRAPRLVLGGDEARTALLGGIERMAMLLRPTLGPVGGTVAVASIVPGRPPEVLDDAGTIARRVERLPNPFEDMGAMLVRHLAWTVRQSVGDGAATAAVVGCALARQASAFLAAGGDPVRLEAGLARGAALAAAELRRMAVPVADLREVAAVARGAVREPELAETVAEAVDSVGPDGAVLVEDGHAGRTACEYIEGMRWAEGVVSPYLLPPGRPEARLTAPMVLTTDHSLREAHQLLPVLETCLAAGRRSLFIVASHIQGAALELLITNLERGVLTGTVAVRAPGTESDRLCVLEDIAVATGGRLIGRARGDQLRDVRIEDLGGAREAWATRQEFGILGGHGAREAIRRRVIEARAELGAEAGQGMALERIGRLSGVSAVIRVGAPTASEQATLRPRIEAAVRSVQAALREGAVPGGGAALLACGTVLGGMAMDGEEAVGFRMLGRALEEPLRAIAGNAGFDGGTAAGEAVRRGASWTLDVLEREWVEADRAGILDPLPVALAALEAAVDLATTVISTEALARRRHPPVSINP